MVLLRMGFAKCTAICECGFSLAVIASMVSYLNQVLGEVSKYLISRALVWTKNNIDSLKNLPILSYSIMTMTVSYILRVRVTHSQKLHSSSKKKKKGRKVERIPCHYNRYTSFQQILIRFSNHFTSSVQNSIAFSLWKSFPQADIVTETLISF